MKKVLSTAMVAKLTGLCTRRILQLAPALIANELAERPGRSPVFFPGSVEWIKSLPETRGRKKKVSDK